MLKESNQTPPMFQIRSKMVLWGAVILASQLLLAIHLNVGSVEVAAVTTTTTTTTITTTIAIIFVVVVTLPSAVRDS